MVNSSDQQGRGLRLYILVAMAFSAVCFLIPQYLAGKAGYLLPTQDNFFTLRMSGFQNSEHRWAGVMFNLATYGPFLAAVIAVTVESGKAGISRLLVRALRWRIRWTWYLAAILLAAGIALPPVLIAFLAGMAEGHPFLAAVPLSSILIFFLWQLFTSGLGEEVGWRGYLLPRLQRTGHEDRAIWVHGLIWAVWHYPFVIPLFLGNMAALPLAEKLVAIIPPLAGFTITIVGAAFLHSWLYNNSQSVLPSILFHALSNTCAVLFGASALMAGPLAILPGIMPWVAVFVISKKCGKASFLPRSPA